MTEDEMFGWHEQLNGHESDQTQGDSEGQGSLVCCTPWSCRVRHNIVTEQQQYLQYASRDKLSPSLKKKNVQNYNLS